MKKTSKGSRSYLHAVFKGLTTCLASSAREGHGVQIVEQCLEVMPEATRTDYGNGEYGEEDVERLAFIRYTPSSKG